MLGQEIEQKLKELRALCQFGSGKETVHISFHLNSEGWLTEIRERTPESLKGVGISMQNLRGEFIRGWSNGSSNDPDRASRTNSGDGTTGDNVGTKQADAFQGHRHRVLQETSNLNQGAGGIIGDATSAISDTDTIG